MTSIENQISHSENIAGPWYVADHCISCELCEEIAPSVFRAAEDGTQHIVYHQPENRMDEELTEEAASLCPVEAILKK